jgi:ABC-type transport system substrate-binding protein
MSYWSEVLSKRTSRRRAIAGTGAAAAGAAFLAACGGSDSGGGSASKDKSSLLYKLVEETKNVKRGGTYIDVQSNGIATGIDPMAIGAYGNIIQRAYSQLFRISDGVLKNTDGTPQGDLLTSWELSPDKLTLTGKIDPGAGTPDIAPLNGRKFDADDVLFSWERFKATGNFRRDIANETNPSAPIVSITAPDKQTLVLKLAEPNAGIYTLLAQSGLGYFYIMPKETADLSKYDPKKTAAATGPYYLTALDDTQMRFKRNPNFKRAALKDNEPYIDEIFSPIITDNSQVQAQFRSGAVYDAVIQPDQVLGMKKDAPELLMYAQDPITSERIYFGQNPESPFRDERLRLAYFKCIDRDAYIAGYYNTDTFEKAGLPAQTFWEASFHQASWSGWVLDPKNSPKEYGDKAKNFQFDIAEAKKLVEAAGKKTPFEYDQVISKQDPTSFGPLTYKRTEIFMNMVENSGVFKLQPGGRTLLTWAIEWVPKIRTSGGKFSGTSWGPDTSPLDPSVAAFFVYNSKGGYFEGGDATLEDLTTKIKGEFDQAKQKELVREVQRYDAGKFFNQKVGAAGGFGLVWPVVRNAYVYRGGTGWQSLRNSTASGPRGWIDPTQAPLKKA